MLDNNTQVVSDTATSYLPEMHSLARHLGITQCMSECVCCGGVWKHTRVNSGVCFWVAVCKCSQYVLVCISVCSRPPSSRPEMCGWLMKRWRTWLLPLKRSVPPTTYGNTHTYVQSENTPPSPLNTHISYTNMFVPLLLFGLEWLPSTDHRLCALMQGLVTWSYECMLTWGSLNSESGVEHVCAFLNL